MTEDESRQQDNQTQIITFLIKASQGNTFSGVNIFKATDAVGLKFGNMNIFNNFLCRIGLSIRMKRNVSIIEFFWG